MQILRCPEGQPQDVILTLSTDTYEFVEVKGIKYIPTIKPEDDFMERFIIKIKIVYQLSMQMYASDDIIDSETSETMIVPSCYPLYKPLLWNQRMKVIAC